MPKAMLILAGIVVTDGLQSNPVTLAYIVVGGLVAIGVVLALRQLGKSRLVKRIGTLAGRVAAWVAELGADFSMGAGFGILLAVGLGNWAGWVLFGVFFALAVQMISISDLLRKIT